MRLDGKCLFVFVIGEIQERKYAREKWTIKKKRNSHNT
jgi:hypothetical protein